MFWLSPRTLTSYDAYFYGDYREAYVYFADRPGTTIYSAGLRPFFLLGRQAQHRVVYDLNQRGDVLLTSPAAFIDTLAQCVAPEFFVFSDHQLGAAYLSQLPRGGQLRVVLETQHVVVLHDERGPGGARDGCPARYFMSG